MGVPGINEVRWPEGNDLWSTEYEIINTARKAEQRGVRIGMNKALGKRVQNYS